MTFVPMFPKPRDVRVRTADGIHLNVSGTAIAAKLIATALRKP